MLTTTTYIDKVLTAAKELNVSDIHLTTGIPPVFRMHGTLRRFGEEMITPEHSEAIAKAIANIGMLKIINKINAAILSKIRLIDNSILVFLL